MSFNVAAQLVTDYKKKYHNNCCHDPVQSLFKKSLFIEFISFYYQLPSNHFLPSDTIEIFRLIRYYKIIFSSNLIFIIFTSQTLFLESNNFVFSNLKALSSKGKHLCWTKP